MRVREHGFEGLGRSSDKSRVTFIPHKMTSSEQCSADYFVLAKIPCGYKG